MKIVIGGIVVAVAALVSFLYKAFQISGRENDDQQQLEYIWELQEKKNQKRKNNLPGYISEII